MNSVTKKKVGEIEFFRCFFAVVIMLRHAKTFIGPIELTPFPGGAFGVEFFFVVTGYLLMASIDKMTTKPDRLGNETLGFLWKKIKVFYPEMLISTAVAFVVTAIIREYDLKQSISTMIDIVWEVLLVSQTGLHTGEINGADWYLSAMLLCTTIIYPILRKNKDVGGKIVLPLMMLFLFGYLCQTYEGLRGPTKWHNIFMKGFMRGFAEMCLGIITYQVTEKLKSLDLNRFGAVVLSIIKWGCYLCILRYMSMPKWNDRDIFYCLLFAIAIGIAFSRKSIDSKFFDNKICYYLGDFSLLIYLNNVYISNAFKGIEYIMNMSIRHRLILYVLIVIITSSIIRVICKILRQNWSKISTMLRRTFLVNP